MSEATNKLKQDIIILEAMVVEIEEYLMSDVLFWPLMKSSLPRLTLGGYLMRQHRLAALGELLDEDEEQRLQEAMDQFNEALVERVVRFEEKAHVELRARLRQWSEYLKDLKRESSGYRQNYATAVEIRAMIEALLDKLKMPPYRLQEKILEQLIVYDRVLSSAWRSGDFVWPEEWKPAYPKETYWWLYGTPSG